MNYRRIATVTGWLWIVTFVTSIPTRFVFYKTGDRSRELRHRRTVPMPRRSSRSGPCWNSS